MAFAAFRRAERPASGAVSFGIGVAVRGFLREARGYWQIQRAKNRQRKLTSKGLAEGEGLGSNGLQCRVSADRLTT